ncbi:glutathione S-transferase N-terminal domain-containing protein [Halomonas cerina]|uniref:Glutathione S-transferase n=1 Tax=Halomonas cerina TaxID=447424 RepID=A0A839V5N1_9GAMM|nr:glutathione S-transferase N-terminal domain-containing protein [Halomonas cerina]MBB3189310.1 glutathione S-transferase [Halomonas cerina]
MSRTTRLHDLFRVMRHHPGPLNGPHLAETLGVSLRTLYQDIGVLKAVGVEIERTPGEGYVLAPGVWLPSLALTEAQLDALALGLTRVRNDAANPLATPADEVLEKVAEALPEELDRGLARLDPTAEPSASEPVAAAVPDPNELIFYTHPLSRGGIVHWMLEELGVPYRMVVLEYGTTMKSPEYLALNPMGKVPAIRHGDVVVTEAAAICAYLAGAFPAAGLAPPPNARGDYYRWLFFAAGPLETAVSLNGLLGIQPTVEQQGRLGCGDYATLLDTLAGAVDGRRYIAGEAFSAADVYVGSHLGWGLYFGTIPWRAEFETYWAGLRERPARLRCEAFVEQALAQQA